MKPGFLDWVGRVAMLVLAGMVTLSIIGSIAAIPSGSIETRLRLDQPPPGRKDMQPSDPDRVEPERGSRGTGASPDTPAVPGDSPPSEPPGPARWLEAITYALLALVGLAALATLLLWRGVRERRRIADALEDLAARR